MNKFSSHHSKNLWKTVIHLFTTLNNYNILNTILLLTITIPLFSQVDSNIQLANEYLIKGEKQKALELYREAVKNDQNVPLVHNNYLNALTELGLYDEAQRYLNRVIKKFPDNLLYQTDAAWVYLRSGDVLRAERLIKELIEANKANTGRIKLIADQLMSRSLAEYSIQALLASRKTYNNPSLFCMELAMLYRIRGQKEEMINEYITYVTQDAYNLQYVKNVLQVLLEPDDMEVLERKLVGYAQLYPDKEVYSDLLIWLNVQQKNFFNAYIQARALDRRTNSFGERSFEVARLALNNGDYETAGQAFRWIIKNYPGGAYYVQSRRGLIESREEALRKTYPIPPDSIKQLVKDYQFFIADVKPALPAWEAQRNLARLYNEWLDEKATAIKLLNEVITAGQASKTLVSQAKLDLGDIYLQKGEWWESTLLYSQVEKAMKETESGYEAKLKNAKLWYYKGDFKLAAEHLDVLKEATSREIANDAMELSIRIKENLAMDSSGMALRALAQAELLLQQNKTDKALRIIDEIKQGKIKIATEEASVMGYVSGTTVTNDSMWVSFPNYAILDEVYWLEAEIFFKKGQYNKVIERLDKIIDEFPTDVLADDAFFKKTETYEIQLGQPDRAQTLYLEFLNRFPGSIYAAEARKRYRKLRGDLAPDQF
ncbi:MAG: tetratricopeptide repeat protein [Cyclobacteriaceae bacterium]|nr:tetratricopeptide repeat protein [Cyclobacteriaceae bacterium]